MNQSISILIPTHNRSDLLEQTLQSLQSLRLPEGVQVELIVVANNCSDNTLDVCQSMFPKMPFPARVVEEFKPGLNEARNRAVLESQYEICALLDNDVWVDPGWLEGVLRAYVQYPADIVGGEIELWWQAVDRPDWFRREYEGLLSRLDLGDQIVELFEPRLVGANFSFKKDLCEQIGMFRSGFDRVGNQLLSGGETEFTLRAIRAGARIFYTPEASLKHWVGPERLQHDYLVGVAKGNAKSRIMMKESFGLRQFLRSVVGHAYLVTIHEPLRWLALLRADRSAALTHLLKRANGTSGLIAALRRGLRISA